jgi:protein-S-isoprenylcysteine O-methyltransferase Ste14
MAGMDTAFSLVIPLLWLAWIVYWLALARGNKDNSRKEPIASRLAHIVPLGVGGYLLFSDAVPRWLLRSPIFPGNWVTDSVGLACIVIGLALTVWAREHLGKNWSGTVTVKVGHELVRSGPYRLVRHPIYTGLLLAFVGSAVARDEWRAVVALVIIFGALWRKFRFEEKWMGEQFGTEYVRYRAEVPALIPQYRRSS